MLHGGYVSDLALGSTATLLQLAQNGSDEESMQSVEDTERVQQAIALLEQVLFDEGWLALRGDSYYLIAELLQKR